MHTLLAHQIFDCGGELVFWQVHGQEFRQMMPLVVRKQLQDALASIIIHLIIFSNSHAHITLSAVGR